MIYSVRVHNLKFSNFCEINFIRTKKGRGYNFKKVSIDFCNSFLYLFKFDHLQRLRFLRYDLFFFLIIVNVDTGRWKLMQVCYMLNLKIQLIVKLLSLYYYFFFQKTENQIKLKQYKFVIGIRIN